MMARGWYPDDAAIVTNYIHTILESSVLNKDLDIKLIRNFLDFSMPPTFIKLDNIFSHASIWISKTPRDELDIAEDKRRSSTFSVHPTSKLNSQLSTPQMLNLTALIQYHQHPD